MEALSVPGTLESLEPVGRYVMGAATEAGLPKSAAYKLRLAVDEVVTNIVVHGYAESGLAGDVQLQAEVDDERLTIIVEDTATPFDPRTQARPDDLDKPLEERDIGGLGVYLVLESVDAFQYEHDGVHNRNIFMVKRSAPDSPNQEATHA